jgi:4-oxalocrotonate tautomerase
MAIIKIEIGMNRSKAVKKELIYKVSEVAAEVLNEPKSNIMVILTEVKDENWGVAGITLEEQKYNYKNQE